MPTEQDVHPLVNGVIKSVQLRKNGNFVIALRSNLEANLEFEVEADELADATDRIYHRVVFEGRIIKAKRTGSRALVPVWGSRRVRPDTLLGHHVIGEIRDARLDGDWFELEPTHLQDGRTDSVGAAHIYEEKPAHDGIMEWLNSS